MFVCDGSTRKLKTLGSSAGGAALITGATVPFGQEVATALAGPSNRSSSLAARARAVRGRGEGVRAGWRRADAGAADAIVPEAEGGIEPLHACYRPGAVAAAAKRVGPDAGRRALRDAMAPVTVVDATACPGDLTRSARNGKTVAELERVRAGSDATDGEG